MKFLYDPTVLSKSVVFLTRYCVIEKDGWTSFIVLRLMQKGCRQCVLSILRKVSFWIQALESTYLYSTYHLIQRSVARRDLSFRPADLRTEIASVNSGCPFRVVA